MGGGEIMAKYDIMAKVGSWAFLIGILIAGLVGLYQAVTYEQHLNGEIPIEEVFFMTNVGGTVAWVLAIIGIIIGILTIFGKGTITRKEIPGFLFAGIALVVMGGVFSNEMIINLQPYIGSLLFGISFSLSIFVAPTVGILALKAIWDMGKDV
jgi:hypothetical protein